MKILPKILFALILFCVVATLAHAADDTLYLKDKTIRVGKIISRDSQYVKIKSGGDNLLISMDDILRIAQQAPKNLILPDIGIALNAGLSSPQNFGFPDNYGIRLTGRYMLTHEVGVYASFNYMTWDVNFDTLKINPLGNIKGPHDSTTETFTAVAVSPRIGAFFVAPLSKTSQLLFGFDMGLTFFSGSDQDSATTTESGFSYSIRADLRFAIADNLALLLGGQYESFHTSFIDFEDHSFATGASRRIGDILLSAGIELGM